MNEVPIGEQVKELAELMNAFRDRIVVEDGTGFPREVRRIRALGTRTDDPAIVLDVS